MYLINYLDQNNEEYLGTTRTFKTDGRYSIRTVSELAINNISKLMYSEDITGYVIYKNSWNSKPIKTVIFKESIR